jgi:hypothetical protein
VLAGSQSGKTSWSPWWLAREIEVAGPGDYIAVTSTYGLFKLKMLPALREVFEHVLKIGRYWAGDGVLESGERKVRFLASKSADRMHSRIILRSAESPSGLESATAKGAWIDEGGQPEFTIDTWRAIRRRLSLAQGRCLLTTTLYNFGWLRTDWYDRWQKGDPEFDIIHFDSTENPAFPREEWEAAKASMPDWQFQMQYRGRYERPAGLIYDSFDESKCLIPRIPIPDTWPRCMGLDFGGVNTAATFFAEEPGTPRRWLYRTYHAGRRTAKEHAGQLKQDQPNIPLCVGGSKSEGQWRTEFAAAGLPVMEPGISDVEVGILRVYSAHKRNEIMVFNDLDEYLKEKRSYSRKLDEQGLPTDQIEDKERFHIVDSERYICSYMFRLGDGYLHEGSTVTPDRQTVFGRKVHIVPAQHEYKPGILTGGLGGIRQGTALFGSRQGR